MVNFDLDLRSVMKDRRVFSPCDGGGRRRFIERFKPLFIVERVGLNAAVAASRHGNR